MKKTFLLLVALFATMVGASAQGQTATLQQGDKMTPFYGRDAFRQAYNAAPQKGGVITLSAGTFNQVDSVMKQVKIIGNGYKENKTVIDSTLYVKADNVTVEGLDVFGFDVKGTNHLTVKHCNISGFLGFKCMRDETNHHKNTIIDQCIIGWVSLRIPTENFCIKNSILMCVNGNNGQSNNILFSNCLLACQNAKYLPVAVFRNNIIGIDKYYTETDLTNLSGSEFYNNVFFGGIDVRNIPSGAYMVGRTTLDSDKKWNTPVVNWVESQICKNNTVASYGDIFGDSDVKEALLAPIITTFKGDDGTVVGPYGGIGFTENPGIPRIVESKIDSNTDADGKLNVKIKVEVNQ